MNKIIAIIIAIFVIVLSFICMVVGSIAVASFDKEPKMKTDSPNSYNISAVSVGIGVAGLLVGGFLAYNAKNME